MKLLSITALICLSMGTAAGQTKPDAALPAPSSEEQANLLDSVRHYALNYTRGLPDFICLEQNRRYEDTSGMQEWHLVDILAAKLSFFNQQEEYRLISQNGHTVKNGSYGSVEGAVSMGDFGSAMYDIFDPASHAAFAWKRWTNLRGRLTQVFDYRIPLESSKYVIEWSEKGSNVQKIKAAYRGSIFMDNDLNTIVRIDQEAVNIQPSFPIRQARETLDYDFTKVGGREFFLPLVATLEMHAIGGIAKKNVKEFRLYQKFSADAVIKFDGELPPLSDDKTKEQAPRKSK
jgi:hypothetical protein